MKGKQVVGQACTVTSGPNKGKNGTYTVDEEGNTWCEGDWGGTQCVSKCADAKAQASVFEYEAPDGIVVHEVNGLFEVEGLGIFQANVIMDADTGERRKVVAIPLAANSLKDLRESGSEVERRAADLLESHLKGRKQGYQ